MTDLDDLADVLGKLNDAYKDASDDEDRDPDEDDEYNPYANDDADKEYDEDEDFGTIESGIQSASGSTMHSRLKPVNTVMHLQAMMQTPRKENGRN